MVYNIGVVLIKLPVGKGFCFLSNSAEPGALQGFRLCCMVEFL